MSKYPLKLERADIISLDPFAREMRQENIIVSADQVSWQLSYRSMY
jgi:hypothetical protein